MTTTLNNASQVEATTSTYEQQALDFLNQTGASIEIKFIKNDYHFKKDESKSDIYQVNIKRGNRSYSFKFGQSLVNSGFYFQIGKKRIEIDRKYIDNSKQSLYMAKWKLNAGDFNPSMDSIHYPKLPTNYDILACLQKYDVGTFEDFCSGFGYDEDSKTAEDIYKGVCAEYAGLCTLFTDSEIEKMQEIN